MRVYKTLRLNETLAGIRNAMKIINITASEFDEFAPKASTDYCQYLVSSMNKILKRYEINRSPLRLCYSWRISVTSAVSSRFAVNR